MKNFIFKSADADLQKMFQLLETIQKNGLYCTYRIDSLLKNFNKLLVDKHLQKQVDEYFNSPPAPPPTQSTGDYPGDIEPEEEDDSC